MKSYVDEYERKYEQPYIGRKVTGFSGIDPSLSNEELQKIMLSILVQCPVKIDSGEIH